MKILILTLLVLFAPQKPEPVKSELPSLRAEFVDATKKYKASLARLLQIYETNVRQAEEKLELSRKLAAENLVSRKQVEENEHTLVLARRRVEETQKQISDADQQIADVLDEQKLDQEYKRAVQQRRKARRPKCSNWRLTASQRTTQNSVSFSYKFVCLH